MTARRLPALAGGLLVCAFAFASVSAPPAFAATTPSVNLGQAAGYAVISGASVANTGNSTVRGDIGAPAQPSGFGPGVIVGNFQVAPADATAYNDMQAAYTAVQARTGGTALPALTTDTTLAPGLYNATAAVAVPASVNVTLDGGGDPNAVFVFQVNGALGLGAGAKVILTGRAQASNVFWQVTGGFSLGAGGQFVGTALASTTGGIGANSVVNGRVLAQTAVTMDTDQFYSAPPTMTLNGGAAEDINNSTPTITGTTNVGTASVVTVTVAGQTLHATPAQNGNWSVSPTVLANGTYTVQASTADGAGNVGSATQQLTIDITPPLIVLDGAPSMLTNSATPTIAGSTDAASGTLIHVDVEAQTLTATVNGTVIVQSVGAQTLAAVVQSDGSWNVRPAHLGEGARTVTAAVTDPAGNTSTATEQLTVDTSTPVAPTPTAPAPGSPTPPTGTPPTATPPTATSPTRTSPTSPAPPASITVSSAPKRVSLSSRTLTAQHPVTVRFTLAKRGTVELKLVEMVRGEAKVIGTVTLTNRKAGKGSYTLTKHFAGHTLGRGSYQLSVRTTLGKSHSKAVTEMVSVR